MAPTGHQPRRADALKNREHILRVAYEAFAETGTTSLNEIAKRAGVGPGTLYRHFPTREALILAVYWNEIERLVHAVDQVLEENDDPRTAFRAWFERLAGYVRLKHGLGEALNSATVQELVDSTYAPVTAAVESLLHAGQELGQFREDVDAADVLLLMGFLWRVAPGPAGEEQGRRITQLVLDALRRD